MSNNKQSSSVEWLCERLALKLGTPMAISFYIDHAEEIAQAKAMHKDEIMEAHYATQYGCFSKDYYNETFGGKDEE